MTEMTILKGLLWHSERDYTVDNLNENIISRYVDATEQAVLHIHC